MTIEFFNKILIDPSSIEEESFIYNYSEKSESAKFYYDQFAKNDENEMDPIPDFSKVPSEMKEAMSFLKEKLSESAIVLELGGGKNQFRSGYPNTIFKNYIPLDISYSSIKAYVHLYNRCGIVADACKLPFKDNSIDAVFTHTFLEHPLNPDEVLLEIDRILKPGGFVIHSDAWNCRWWQCYGIVGIKKFNKLTSKEKVIFFAAKLTEFKLFRHTYIVFKRIAKLIFFSEKQSVKLKFKKLTPNYNLHLYCDEDAASSIDPIDVLIFYKFKKYKTIPALTFVQKIFFKNLNIYFQKGI